MKNSILKISFLFIMAASIFQGCKKGEDDPFISLRSRDARLSGTWELSKQEYSQVETNYSVSSSKITVNTATRNVEGGILTIANKNTSSGTILTNTSSSSSYSLETTVNKDGTFTNIAITNGEKVEVAGSWNWFDLGKSKTGIYFIDLYKRYEITELKEKEMVLTENDRSKTTQTDGSYTETVTTAKYTYSKKK